MYTSFGRLPIERKKNKTMATNTGKIFEQDFKKSVPDYAMIYRLPDSAQSFGGSSNLRFSRKNPFDYLIYDSRRRILYALEMKTVKGKSISFERSENESGEIHFHQIEGLRKWDSYNGIICGFIIEFRKIEKTAFIKIKEFDKLINIITKKSFNYDDLALYKIEHNVISQRKIRTHYAYGVDEFLQTIKE